MNKDQAKGHARTSAGMIQEFFGNLFGSRKQKARGMARQMAGRTQKALGDGRPIIRKARTPRKAS